MTGDPGVRRAEHGTAGRSVPGDVVRVAVFPGAGCLTLWHAVDSGVMQRYGVTVEITEVRSSDEQLALWDRGAVDVVHTAADHFLKGRDRRGRVVRAESLGVLGVYVRSEMADRLEDVLWAVDHPASAFALLLRAALAGRGVDPPPQHLVAVGGTRQRLASIMAGETAGAVLHPPFDAEAEGVGLVRLAAHTDVEQDLVPAVVVVDPAGRRPVVDQYLDALTEAESSLFRGGARPATEILRRRGWSEELARRAALAVLEARPDSSPESLLRGLQAAARLRTRADLPVVATPEHLLAVR